MCLDFMLADVTSAYSNFLFWGGDPTVIKLGTLGGVKFELSVDDLQP